MWFNCHTFLETIEATDLLSQTVANLLDTVFQRGPKKGDTVCDHFMCSYVCDESTTYGNGLLMKENLDWNGRNLGLDSHEKKNLVKWTREKGGTQHRSGKKNEKIGPNWRCEVSVLGLEAMNKPILKPAF
jgi:hypothetical protein